MKRILLMIVVCLVAFMGTSSAYEAKLFDENGIVEVGNPLQLKPGDSITLSYYAFAILEEEQNEDFPYALLQKSVRSGSPASASPDDIQVVFNRASFIPGGPSYMDERVVTISLSEDAPEGARYYVLIGAGDQSAELTEFQSVSRTIESIPEFPTVALPIAAILGLAFFMQRRKEE
jgi:hypothetical protein